MSVFAVIHWPRRPAPVATASGRPPLTDSASSISGVVEVSDVTEWLEPAAAEHAASESAAVLADLPPVVQPGPNGCTKRVTCRGRAGKDGRCAAHKEAPGVPAPHR